jgi:hypothetical protein
LGLSGGFHLLGLQLGFPLPRRADGRTVNSDIFFSQGPNEFVAVVLVGTELGNLAFSPGRRFEVVVGVFALMNGRPLCRQILPYALLGRSQQVPALSGDPAEFLLTTLYMVGYWSVL